MTIWCSLSPTTIAHDHRNNANWLENHCLSTEDSSVIEWYLFTSTEDSCAYLLKTVLY